MNIIVPLAGPDFVLPNGSVKPLTPIKDSALLRHTLDTRPWASESPNYTFIFHKSTKSDAFIERHLRSWYPDAKTISISNYTRGAAFSALIGLSAQVDFSKPIIVDLADIIYKTIKPDICEIFETDKNCGAVALVFESSETKYSYLRLNDEGSVIEAAEKRVISSTASAGTYIFRDTATYLRAVAHAIDNENTQTFKGLFYVCPLFNGVLAQCLNVKLLSVTDVIDIKP